MAVKDKKQQLPLTFLAFVLYHLLLASLSSNNPKQSCSRGGLVLEETRLQYVQSCHSSACPHAHAPTHTHYLAIYEFRKCI